MNDTKGFYIYVGHADPPHSSWKFIPDTPEERQRAIEDGYTAGSTMSFEYEPEKGKSAPIRRGSLFFDFDSRHNAAVAIDRAREYIDRLVERYGIDPDCLRYWVSGGKGCHIELPAALYGGEAGHPELPQIQKEMLLFLGRFEFHDPRFCEVLDFQLYCKGKGRLLRWSNIKRANGRYKVQVSAQEFFRLGYPELERLTLTPRTDFDHGTKEPVQSPGLARIYDIAVRWWRKLANGRNPVSGVGALFNCQFINHCFEDRTTLPEEHWRVMISNLATFGNLGRDTIHLFSQDYPTYNFEETEKKIEREENKPGAITCDYIKNSLGFDCGKACGVRCPADLWICKKTEEARRAIVFTHKPDGLYREPENGDGEAIKICSPLKVLGKMRNPEGVGWARLVGIGTPDGRKKEVCIHMRDMNGRGEGVIRQLLDCGVEPEPHRKAIPYLLEYLINGASNDSPLLCIQRVGWTGDTYILPDASFGGELKEKIHFQAVSTDNLHQAAGTLDEWKEHVGRYCRGNSLLELLVSYALTGPLLRLVGMEGGGIHVFGESSTGKSTLAMVVGSVCGGGGPRGYILQWRTTDNALEVAATLHNDNLLILDEISQASAEAVSKITYMLANGQGKERMRPDASRRKAYTWHLNFLSTGELTINDKIEELGKYKAMAGQMVRVIDLPIDGLETENTFQELHGLPDGARLSELLRNNACRFYGSPFRSFMTVLCADLEANVAILKREMNAFVSEYCPVDASGQVMRVAQKFSLPAAVGELAISFGVLPFEPGASKKAAGEWFKIWLNRREGHGNTEIIKAIQRLQDHLSVNSSRYVDRSLSTSYIPHNHEGYTWKENGKRHFLMLMPVIKSLTRGVTRNALRKELERLGYLAYNSEGNLKDSISVNNDTKRGWVFIPSVWEGEPTSEEVEEERQMVRRGTIEDLFTSDD